MSDSLSPREIAESIVEIGKKKSELPLLSMVVLGMLAGVYISLGTELYMMVSHDLPQYLGIGFTRFLRGSVFSVGLILVVIAGAELFTGNCLMLTGVLAGKISAKKMLRNWLVVYLANFAGALLLVIMMYYSGQWKFGELGVAKEILTTAVRKVNLPLIETLCRAIGCNLLVCLAVWMATAGRDIISKIFAIYFPIMTFVASVFEHSVANMLIIPMGLFLKGAPAAVEVAGVTQTIESLTLSSFLIKNLIPVTLGNIVGGAFCVGGAYYLAYLRKNV